VEISQGVSYFVKSKNEFPLQATYFPVGERRIASSATTPFRVLPVLLSHGSQVALHSPHKSVTAAVVTTGEKSDGKYLKELIEKSKTTGMEIDTVIGDAAYSEKDNLQLAKTEEFQLVSKLNPQITQGGRTKEEFEFNKDAGMYVCKAGHMAIRTTRTNKKECRKESTSNLLF